MLPRDAHVHTEWSWDAPHGSMEGACARAVQLGLPSVAFTDHADFTDWRVSSDVAAFLHDLGGQTSDGVFSPPALDLEGYLECLQRCRERYPDLQILSGVELGEPHWHPEEATDLLSRGGFDLVIAALHSLPGEEGGHVEVSDAYLRRSEPDVLCEYLAEAARLIEAWDDFDVLAHIDYAARAWPAEQSEYRTSDFEAEYRAVLRTLASSGRALEVNTRLPLDPLIVSWWRQEGGTAVTFGSDVHDAHFLAQGFAGAAAVAAANGYGPGSHRLDFWTLQ